MVLDFSNLHSQLFGCNVHLLAAQLVISFISFYIMAPLIDKVCWSLGFCFCSRVALDVEIVISNHVL